MIRYLEHTSIDFERWDDCIAHAPNGNLYAWSWYLNMVSPGWNALIEGDYHAVMPLPSRKKWGVSYVFQPFFAQQLGVFSRKLLSPETTARFLHAIPSHVRYIDICLNKYNRLEHHGIVRTRNMLTHELDLIPDHASLKASYSKNTLRNLKKAEKNGVFVTTHGSPDDIIRLFRHHRGRHLSSYSDYDYQLLKHLIYAGLHRGLVCIYSAYSAQNSLCAGLVFFRSHDKYIFLFSGSDQVAKENGAMFMLVDSFIRDHAGQAMILDFEGSVDPNLARFYRGFGSKECVFLQVEINRLPFLIKSMSDIYLLIKRKWLKKYIKTS
jgi:hypothetical protein